MYRFDACVLIEHRAGWVRTTRLIAMGVGTINECLIGEIQLWCPVDGNTARELIPLLIHHTGGWIPKVVDADFAWNIGEMLLILGPPQTSGKLQLFQDAVIGFSKHRIGIERIGILA